MKLEDRDLAYLWDMRGFAREAFEFVRSVAFEELEKDSMRKLALERSLELLGEAAKHVSSNYRTAHPQIAWPSLIGQRNVLAHEYGKINHRRLYDSARRNIPPLLEELERILKDSQ